MDKKHLNLTLECNGKTINIGKDSDYKLVSVEGLESSDYEVNLTKNIQYDGSYVKSKRIAERSISFEAEFSIMEEAETERQKLMEFFNPKKTGRLTVNHGGYERYVFYEFESFKEKRKNLYEPLSFQVDMICADPYFKDYVMGEQIATWTGGWKLKFKLPFRFKQKGETRKKIYNEGHVETPVEIIFKGPAVNPSVTNITTGEFIKVNRSLTSDDILYITTGFGNKKVEIERNGTRTNAFNYINLDSTFFNLEVGDNLIEYTTDSLEPQSVEIRYRNKYLGV